MDVISLHLVDPVVVRSYVAALEEREAPDPAWTAWWAAELPASLTPARGGDERAANRISLGLAWALASAQPSYLVPGFGLSTWEARIDRGVGMFMRPPSRLFQEAGLDVITARTMPIRLDPQLGMMGGAYVPSRLVPGVWRLLEDQFERTVRRLVEAEYDPVVTLGPVREAIDQARALGVGVFEALDAFGPDGQAWPGMQVIGPDRRRLDKVLLQRIELARKEPKKPGLFARLLGKSTASRQIVPNGHAREE